MEYLVTFLEGVITFASPCLLPMLPIYIAYFAGDAKAASRDGSMRRTLICSVAFVAGFSVVFTLLGALAGTAGSLVSEYQPVLDTVCGLVVIALGLNYLGALEIGSVGKVGVTAILEVPAST